MCYEFGDGVTQDYQEARRLFSQASAHGYAPASQDLTRLEQKIRNECPLLGKQVVITGTSREDLNGRAGVATSFDHARGRYVVELDSREGANEKEQLKQLDERIRTECPLLGKRVIITSTSREDLNGKVGVATDFDHAKGRYVVTLNGKDGKVVKLKPEHVERR